MRVAAAAKRSANSRGDLLMAITSCPDVLILIPGRTALWQKRHASGRLRRSRLRYSCDAAKAQRVHSQPLLPCVPGALSEAADSRECFARNAECAGRLSCNGHPIRMSPSEERALLPTSRGKDDERALSPTALIYASAHSEASRPTIIWPPTLMSLSVHPLHRQ